LLETAKHSLARELANRRWVLANRNQVTLKDLQIVRTIGEGTFGRVKLVSHVPTSRLYALKCLQKRSIEQMAQAENVVTEVKLLSTCAHPQILKLAAAFEGRDALYMVLDFIQGGELLTLLEARGELDLTHTRFYVASVVAALVFLGSMNIAYRDLKPDNLMLTAKGELRVIDLGFTKILGEGRAFTFCGTPEYMAPEILRHCGYSLPVDWWALGVVMLELLTGITTFTPLGDEDEDCFARVLKYAEGDTSILLIEPDLDADATDLINQLLHPDPAQRIDAARAPAHAFFKEIDFYALEKGLAPPPYVPSVKDATDTSHFKEFDEDEPEPEQPEGKVAYPGFQYSSETPAKPKPKISAGGAANGGSAPSTTQAAIKSPSAASPPAVDAGGGGGCCLVQ